MTSAVRDPSWPIFASFAPTSIPAESAGTRNTAIALPVSGAGWTFDARCELFGSVMESKGTMSGDFRDRFRVDLTSNNDGRREAGSIRGEHKGACPAPFKPGDLVSDGRVLMNVLN